MAAPAPRAGARYRFLGQDAHIRPPPIYWSDDTSPAEAGAGRGAMSLLCRIVQHIVNPLLKRRGRTVLLIWRRSRA